MAKHDTRVSGYSDGEGGEKELELAFRADCLCVCVRPAVSTQCVCMCVRPAVSTLCVCVSV